MFRRIVWIVMDSVGIGEMPDAAAYGDEGSDTLGNLAKQRPLHLPNLCRLGLGNIKPLQGLPAEAEPTGSYGKCGLLSPGKDTTTGHWEMAGIILKKPFPVYPHGFPLATMQRFEQAIGRKTLGNKAASGTEILAELGAEHVRTGSPIIYTSADSVFQVAAHEDVMPLEELYAICQTAREMLPQLGRVIARPFRGQPGSFERTANRKDLAAPPPEGMLLDRLTEHRVAVHSVGKISDIFLGRGLATAVKTKDNSDGMRKTGEALERFDRGLLFVNLVDFDQLYGHRNDVEGYARALEAVDTWLPSLPLAEEDLLILTADHGCDPTTPSTDHSREYTPLLTFGASARPGVNLGTRTTLADIGQTVAANFGTEIDAGTSFLERILIL